MNVTTLIDLLKKINPEAQVEVIVDSMPVEFEIGYGETEGCTPADCTVVTIMVDTTQEQVSNAEGYNGDLHSQEE